MIRFNLCEDSWIPIAGSPRRLSLLEVFSEHSPERLAGNPVDKIVILRLLLAVAHAAARIPDTDAWLALTPERLAANIRDYLENHRDCFDLYGDRPFLQFPKLAELGGKTSSPGSLIVSVSAGNKVVLSGWNKLPPLSEAEKVILLLRSSCFACGGKRFDKGVVLSSGVVKKATGSAGTLLGFMGFLHAYMLGGNLWETLRLNLLSEADVRSINIWPAGIGIPFWEQMPTGEADERAKNYRQSYQGQLFPLDKFLLFREDGVIKTSGIAYPGHKEGLIDPALTITSNGKDIRAVWAKTEERPWRQLPALLAFLQSSSRTQPYFLSMGMEKIRLLRAKVCAVWVGGVAVSSNSGEQYLSGMDDYVESEFPFATDFMIGDSYQTFVRLMNSLDEMAKRLYSGVSAYYIRVSGKDNAANQASRAKSVFWERMEPRAQKILDLAFGDEDQEAVRQAQREWFSLLCDVYDEFCPRDTPRQLMAWVEANPRYQSSKRKGTR